MGMEVARMDIVAMEASEEVMADTADTVVYPC